VSRDTTPQGGRLTGKPLHAGAALIRKLSACATAYAGNLLKMQGYSAASDIPQSCISLGLVVSCVLDRPLTRARH
jgi:hypothetical protein